jgi:oligopeptidase B
MDATLEKPMPDSQPPVAEKRPRQLERADGTTFDDPWYWLRERDDPAVTAYLEAENTYAAVTMAGQRDLESQIFDEIRQRIAEDDASAPVFVPAHATGEQGWVYYRRMREGMQYPIHARRPVPAHVGDVGDLPDALRAAVDPLDPPDDEVIVLDENVAAAEHDYFRLGALEVSPDQRLAIEAVDVDGDEVYALQVRDLATGDLFDDRIARAAGSVAWCNDSATFYYTVPDASWRPFQVYRHVLGTASSDDELVFEETDERYWIGVGRTRSERFIAVRAASKITSGWHVIDADDPHAVPREVVPRRDGIDVDLDHHRDQFFLVTNADGAVDFKLCVTDIDNADVDRWRDVVPHRPGVRLEAAEVFDSHLVLSERTEARTQLRVCQLDGSHDRVIAMPDEIYTAAVGPNPSFSTSVLRCIYTSMVAPTEVVDIDVHTDVRFVVKRQQVRGGYDRSAYETWREWAEAPDGTRVPISLVRRRDSAGTPAPCLLYGYGAYEISLDPAFSVARLSLLDRGVVFAMAHVRGGGELGRSWYEHGRLQHKPHTFTDFVACAQHLVDGGIADSERLAIRGGSAGGMLIGAVVNLRPTLWRVAVAEVPFVDVVTTMSDASIPLTVIEYDEWGDPSDPGVCTVMRGYSPVDNVQPGQRPAMLVTAGLHDPRVQYWEPAKWVARLRDSATGGGPVVLKTEMGAGHAGRSGRYDAWRDEAEVLAFIINRLAPDAATASTRRTPRNAHYCGVCAQQALACAAGRPRAAHS